jgi:hypothetical protein
MVGVAQRPASASEKGTDMTKEQKIIRAKVGLLELAKQLDEEQAGPFPDQASPVSENVTTAFFGTFANCLVLAPV